jgi:RES domain-containing protein
VSKQTRSRNRETAIHIAQIEPIEVDGEFLRHCGLKVPPLAGSASGGRWGAEGAYPVLYLGRPRDSVVGEAYRHLVDDNELLTGDMIAARKLIRCDIQVSNILDLRSQSNLDALGLRKADLMTRVGEYAASRAIGHAAHQLGMHGVIAPSATGIGETLALFRRNLPPEEEPIVFSSEIMDGLPADPRRQDHVDLSDARPGGDESQH